MAGTGSQVQSQQHSSDARTQGDMDAEDWTKINDLKERRKIQNRLSQRTYRSSLKRRVEDLEKQVAARNDDLSPTQPTGSCTPTDTIASTLLRDEHDYRNDNSGRGHSRNLEGSTLCDDIIMEDDSDKILSTTTTVPVANGARSNAASDAHKHKSRQWSQHHQGWKSVAPALERLTTAPATANRPSSAASASVSSSMTFDGAEQESLYGASDINDYSYFGNLNFHQDLAAVETTMPLFQSNGDNNTNDNQSNQTPYLNGIVHADLPPASDGNSRESATIGRPMLHLAVESGHSEIISLLIQRGISIDCRDQRGQTAVHLAVQIEAADILSLLLEWGADINAADDDGKTPLHLSTQCDNSVIVEKLLAKAPNVECRDTTGKTALHYAIERGDVTIVGLLLRQGADAHRLYFSEAQA